MGFSGKVVFTSGRSTDLDIRLLDISSGRLAQLTHGSYLNDHATWSAGGKQVAFVSMLEDAIPLLSGALLSGTPYFIEAALLSGTPLSPGTPYFIEAA